MNDNIKSISNDKIIKVYNFDDDETLKIDTKKKFTKYKEKNKKKTKTKNKTRYKYKKHVALSKPSFDLFDDEASEIIKKHNCNSSDDIIKYDSSSDCKSKYKSSENVSELLRKVKYRYKNKKSPCNSSIISNDVSISDLLPDNMSSWLIIGVIYYIYSKFGTNIIPKFFVSQPSINHQYTKLFSNFNKKDELVELITAKVIAKIGYRDPDFIRTQVRDYIMNM